MPQIRSRIRQALSATREGSALAMVLLFLSIVSLLTMITSFQSSTVRRASVRGHYGFEAVEVAESAINEVAQNVTFKDIFPDPDFSATPIPVPSPPGPFPPGVCAGVHQVLTGGPPPPVTYSNLSLFFLGISCEDGPGLSQKYPNYGFHFRTLSDGSPIFVSMSWPATSLPPGHLQEWTPSDPAKGCPNTLAKAQLLHGFVSISPIDMSVLAWRRDFAGIQWQDWGVIHYSVKVQFSDGKVSLGREMQVDRMFSLYLHYPATTGVDDPTNEAPYASDPYHEFAHFIQSRRNIKTVILRS